MQPATRNLIAEYELLLRFDSRREHAGHDYGCGQRGAELGRRRRRLEELGYAGEELELAIADLEPNELAAAYERVGRPRLERVERDVERFHGTPPSSRRTIETWQRVRRAVALELDRSQVHSNEGSSAGSPAPIL